MAGEGARKVWEIVPVAAVTQRGVSSPERMRGCGMWGPWAPGFGCVSRRCPFLQVSTPSTAHKHCTHTAHRWPGDTCRLVPMGHRAFVRAGRRTVAAVIEHHGTGE
eukprot:2490649-Prymnesium_polylepis.1